MGIEVIVVITATVCLIYVLSVKLQPGGDLEDADSVSSLLSVFPAVGFD